MDTPSIMDTHLIQDGFFMDEVDKQRKSPLTTKQWQVKILYGYKRTLNINLNPEVPKSQIKT